MKGASTIMHQKIDDRWNGIIIQIAINNDRIENKFDKIKF